MMHLILPAIILIAVLGSTPELTKDGLKVLDKPFGTVRLIVYNSEAQRAPQKRNRIEGTGAYICIGQPGHKPLWSTSIGEAESWPSWIDYSKAKEGKLRITHNTFDPRQPSKDGVPFRVEEIRLDPKGSINTQDRILLKKERFDAKRADRLAKEVIETIERDNRNHSEGSWSTLYGLLGHLRNMGLDRPAEVLRTFKTIGRHADGAYGETVSSFEDEVSLAKDVKHK